MFLTYPGCRHKPSRATPLEPRGFQRGPQAPLAVPRASELAAGFSLPFWPDKKEDIRRVKKPNLVEPGRVLPPSQKRKIKSSRLRRGQDPALQSKANTRPTRQRAMPRTVSRAASMPPLRIDQTPSQPKNGMAKQTWRAACMRPLQCGAYAIRTIPGRAQHRNFSFLFFNF